MDQVEQVALWTGLFASIVGIVLAAVSMTFTWLVNKRTDDLTETTVQALERIESTVQEVSDGSNQLIRKAWDRMLDGGFRPEPAARVTEEDREVMLGGVTEEVLSERAAAGEDVTLNEGDIDELIRRWATVPTEKLTLDELILKMNSLSGLSRSLLAALVGAKHLTNDEYKALLNSSIAQAVHELRGAGLLVPLKGYSAGPGRPPIVYWLPSSNVDTIKAASLLSDPCSDKDTTAVASALVEIGYPS